MNPTACPGGGESGAEGGEDGGSWGQCLVLHKHDVKSERPSDSAGPVSSSTEPSPAGHGGRCEGSVCLKCLWAPGPGCGGRLSVVVMLYFSLCSISPGITGAQRGGWGNRGSHRFSSIPGRVRLGTAQAQGACGEFTTWPEGRKNASPRGLPVK